MTILDFPYHQKENLVVKSANRIYPNDMRQKVFLTRQSWLEYHQIQQRLHQEYQLQHIYLFDDSLL